MESKVLIALDFDGVLCNSADECLHNIELIQNIKLGSKQRELFLSFRYLVNEPFEYFILFDYIINKEEICEERFSKDVNLQSPISSSRMNKKFFANRNKLINSIGMDEWCKINKPTPFFNCLKDLTNNSTFDFIIVSTKNEDSLRLWLSYYNFSVNGIYGMESYRKYKSKFEIISKISNSYNKVLFVDDNKIHLEKYNWDSINCETVLAGWGYNSLDYDNCKDTVSYIKDLNS